MLTRKLSVSFACRILNVRAFAKTSWAGEKITKDSLGDKRNRCLDHKRALEKCPKPSLVKRCRGRKFFAENIPCSWSNADDYERAYRAIKNRSEKLSKLVDITTNKIIQEIRGEIMKIRCDENSFTRIILRRVEPIIVELSSLDPVCAMRKKHDVLVLNDRTQRELTNHHCKSQLDIESIECELEKLTGELKLRANFAIDLVSSCRRSKSPQDLINCIEHGTREAAKILDDANDVFEKRVKNVKISKDEMISEDKKIVQDVTRVYEKNMTKLISGMIDCIRDKKTN